MHALRHGTALILPLLVVACSVSTTTPAGTDTATAAPANPASSAVAASDADLLAHGEYMVRIGGCNDCHTPGYAEAGGDLPKTQWLLGSPIGWHGPWGTTYPANLRLKLQDMDDAAWIEYSTKLHTRPPMPDFVVRALNDRDRLAIFRFIKSLGAGGDPAPAYLPPGEQPPMPYVDFVAPPPTGAAAAD